MALQTDSMLRRAYAEQLDEVGRMLVRAKILTAQEIRRQGVQFALRDRLEPQRTMHVKKNVK
jgi:hypothetical protein